MRKDELQRTDAEGRLFRIAYASRTRDDLRLPDLQAIAEQAAARNRQSRITGVLLFGQGQVLQWLEGPAAAVCAVMGAIQRDPRHQGVSVLSAGWIDARRFPDWSMQFLDAGERAGSVVPLAVSPDRGAAARVFDGAAVRHWADRDPEGICTAQGLAAHLARSPEESLPPIPERFLGCPRARAGLVDEVCRTLGQGWMDSRYSGFEVTLATVRLNRLMLLAGRPADPREARASAVVLAPDRCSELTGALMKTDLLRSAGYSVRLIAWARVTSLRSSLRGTGNCPIIIYGGRVGIDSRDAKRAAAMADWLRADYPGRTILIGGRSAGPLSEWPDRLAFHSQGGHPVAGKPIDWPALSALAADPVAALAR
ncbi:BLUF domain-containing protein [Rhodovulum sp. BSW8]|uniref:BLUF domain-containing protein n=1 Tax=Rhodovulum sp. BSW8 TaxID=2259645 RepID=UPI0014021110|nr:BLUF domain-containing protein [Rhodovulum sp. BSW8]